MRKSISYFLRGLKGYTADIISFPNDKEYEILVTDTVGFYGIGRRPKVTMNFVEHHFCKVYPLDVNLLICVLICLTDQKLTLTKNPCVVASVLTIIV